MIADLTPFLDILSRHGWDCFGQGRLYAFRRGDEEISMPAGEVPFWAAQIEAPVPMGGGDWYADRLFVSCGQVRSRSGRRITGVTHSRRGEFLYFPAYAEAERVAAVLNLRDRAPVQLEMVL